jgi:hypothetical protein
MNIEFEIDTFFPHIISRYGKKGEHNFSFYCLLAKH